MFGSPIEDMQRWEDATAARVGANKIDAPDQRSTSRQFSSQKRALFITARTIHSHLHI
jgi:hypothetical protein